MRSTLLAIAAAITVTLAATGALPVTGALAQTAPAQPGAASPAAPAPTRARRAPRSTTGPKREPTAGQLAARGRQKECGAQWRSAKAAGQTGGLKWPQYWSQCNARLKGSSV